MQTQIDKEAPAYTIQGKDSICQIFIYSPAPNQGLHLAYFTDDERWVDVGQLCASDYGPWGAEKKMYNPFVVKANDGTWRALWSVNQHAPQFAVAYSEDLITWRPQDYPIVAEKGVKSPVAYQMEDGNFDIYIKTAKGKEHIIIIASMTMQLFLAQMRISCPADHCQVLRMKVRFNPYYNDLPRVPMLFSKKVYLQTFWGKHVSPSTITVVSANVLNT